MDMKKVLNKLNAIVEGNESCNCTGQGEYCPVHGMDECSMTEHDDRESEVHDDIDPDDAESIKAQDDRYYAAIKSGGEIPEEVVEPDRFIRYYEEKYGRHDNRNSDDLSEDVHVTIDGPEANEFLQRLSILAGQPAQSPLDLPTNATQIDTPQPGIAISHLNQAAPMWSDYSDSMDHYDTASEPAICPQCGASGGACECDVEATLENADRDFGDAEYDDEGIPVDPKTYTYNAPNGDQRIVKSVMGDNPLIKENAELLYAKLKKDYRLYVEETKLDASNADGVKSPLTANARDDFEKDPFAGEEPVTDGTHSPVSTVKRQSVLK